VPHHCTVSSNCAVPFTIGREGISILRKAFQKVEERSKIRQMVALKWLQASRVSSLCDFARDIGIRHPCHESRSRQTLLMHSIDAFTSFMSNIKSINLPFCQNISKKLSKQNVHHQTKPQNASRRSRNQLRW
jgi:hypothetical protein